MDYYKDQLKRINAKTEYGVTIKLTDGDGNSTKYLNLNNESASNLVEWLKQNFEVTESEI